MSAVALSSVESPPVSVQPSVRRLTPAEFAQLSDTRGLELDDGLILERDMGGLANWIAGELHGHLRDHLKRHPIGWAFPQDTPYECFPPTPSRVRKPDVSFVRAGRFAGGLPPEGHITVVPDLAAEVVSPNDMAMAVERKIAQFVAAGVRLVWVILPEVRAARVFRADGSVTNIPEGQALDGEDVIPGFHVRLAELFPAPLAGGADPEQADQERT